MNPKLRRSVSLVITASAVLGCEEAAPSGELIDGVMHYTLADSDYTCSLEFFDTGVRLSSDIDGSHPDPTEWITRGPEGGFLSATPGGGAVLRWSADGRFLGSIGSRGLGPGEMGPTAFPFSTKSGTVHVFDMSSGRWLRFFPDGATSSTSSPLFSESPSRGTFAAINDDTLVFSSGGGDFQVIRADGATLATFGPPQPPERRIHRSIVAGSGGDTFWSAHLELDGYTIEEWTIDGTLVRRLSRTPDWLKDEGQRIQAGESFPLLMLKKPSDRELLVQVIGRMMSEDQPGQMWYELIDLEENVVRAASGFAFAHPVGEEGPPMWIYMPESDFGIRYDEDANGLPSYPVVNFRLAGRDGAACRT